MPSEDALLCRVEGGYALPDLPLTVRSGRAEFWLFDTWINGPVPVCAGDCKHGVATIAWRQDSGSCRVVRRSPVRVVALLLVAFLTAGCGGDMLASETSAEPTTSASAAPTEPTPTPSKKPVAKQRIKAPAPTTTKAAVERTGAAARVPRRVIMKLLAKRAERVAASLASASPEILPTDVDPDSNRGLGYRLMQQFGFDADQWQYLDALWQRESGWNHLAENPSSGAYGIPQSLPGTKMATVAPDWRSNPETQITWGLAYISARYGNPEGAWAHSERVGWY